MAKYSLSYFKETIYRRKQTLILIAIVIATTLFLHIAISILLSKNNNTYLPSFGTIYTINVEVYGKDIQIQDGRKLIDWGTVYPGTIITRAFNVTSKSNIKTILIIETTNWIFYNSSNKIVRGPENKTPYMSLIPSQNKTIMAPNQTIELTLTLNVTDSNSFINFLIEKDAIKFSFDIHVYAQGTNK